ncbi:MAG: hypothetical protein DWH73_02490 [Planctomycetota bacterium]|nr:MAG: hypothetical protein DWH73_02490 [Planctomycetota bacterium]
MTGEALKAKPDVIIHVRRYYYYKFGPCQTKMISEAICYAPDHFHEPKKHHATNYNSGLLW